MTFVTSDWHGVSLDTILTLLDRAGFRDDDFLFVLGDVIDRGPHGVELLRWMMGRHNVELILGNHEDMLLDCDFLFDEVTDESIDRLKQWQISALYNWQRNGADPTITGLTHLNHGARKAVLAYLREAPYYDSVSVGGQDYLLVHGGLRNYAPDRRAEDYLPDDFLWARPSLDTRYSKDFVTILGHTPTRYYGSAYRGRILKTDTWWDIDTGAATNTIDGLNPMILCLDTLEETYLDPVLP